LATNKASGGSGLTRREREVVALVAQGLTNREIAKRLFTSERTAAGHLEHIREKLGVSTRSQIATWFAAPPSDERSERLSRQRRRFAAAMKSGLTWP